MKSEQVMQQEIKDMRDKSFKEIERVLHQWDYNGQDMIASFVASLCDVDVADMLSVTNNQTLSQARSLYWYALRYYTQDTYQRISERSKLDGHCFNKDGIGIAIARMSELIEIDGIWKKRWLMIKRMVKLLHSPHDYNLNTFNVNEPQKFHLQVQVPKGEKENVKIDVVEKK